MKTIPSKEQIEVARIKPSRKDYNNHGYYAAKEYLDAHFDTIDFALQFTAKMLDEPSEDMQGLIHEMFGAEEGSELCSVVKGRIVSQAIKEVLDG